MKVSANEIYDGVRPAGGRPGARNTKTGGVPFAAFRVASTARRVNRETGEFEDAATASSTSRPSGRSAPTWRTRCTRATPWSSTDGCASTSGCARTTPRPRWRSTPTASGTTCPTARRLRQGQPAAGRPHSDVRRERPGRTCPGERRAGVRRRERRVRRGGRGLLRGPVGDARDRLTRFGSWGRGRIALPPCPRFIYVMTRARKARNEKVILDDVRCRSTPERRSAWSGRTAPASRRSSRSWPGWTSRRTVRPGSRPARPWASSCRSAAQREEDVLGNVEEGLGEIKQKVDRFNEISAEMAEPDADFDA